MRSDLPPAAVLSIAGSDCSSGAGLQADLKTFQHFGLHGLTAVTCVVSETANVVRQVHPVPPAVVADQVCLMLDSFPVRAMKTGMLYSAAHVREVARCLRSRGHGALVVDPVMVASTGDPLIEPDAVAAYREELLPLARLITPNLPEGETLLGERIRAASDLEPAARMLAREFGTAVLLKGGHLEGEDCVDWLVDGETSLALSAPRLRVKASHGTGCTLSAALAARLALGDSLAEAARAAKDFLGQALAGGYSYVQPADGGALHALNQGTRPA